MNLRDGALAGLVAWAVLGWGCGADRHESTEVENELSVRLLSGCAMDSAALDSAQWLAWDSTGTLLGYGTTDSMGRFAIELSRDPKGGILVEVCRGPDTLRALAGLDTTVVRARTATVLVNSLTGAALTKIGNPRGGQVFPASAVDAARAGGQLLLDSAMGLHLPWKEFASDPAFRAFAPHRAEPPTPLSGFLRAVDVRAARDNLTGSQWLLDLAARPGDRLAQDSLFGRDLAASLVDLRLPDKATTEFVTRLDQSGAKDGHWLETWQKNQVFPDPNDLSIRVPWAVRPEFQPIWLHLVEVTGDHAAALESRLPPDQRRNVPAGRAHQILSLAVAKVVVPDQSILGKDPKPALDALLGPLVQQVSMMLEQVDPKAWGPPVAPGAVDPTAELLGTALASQLPPTWGFSALVLQPEPPRWVSQNYAPWKTPADVRNGLKALLGQNPQWVFPAIAIP